MEIERADLPFKSVNLTAITSLIEKGRERLRKHYGTTPKGEEFNAFVQDVFSLFPPHFRYELIFQSLIGHAGKTLDREEITKIVWRLAANKHKLADGKAVPIWTRQTELEWCPISLLSANPGRGYDDKPGYFFKYKVLAGGPAGLEFNVFWTTRYVKFIARDMGMKKTRKADLRIRDGREIVRMRLYVLFDPAMSKEDRPSYYYHKIPPALVKYNQEIAYRRQRLIPCPEGYTRIELPCIACPQGYDQCPAGTHPKTWEERPCPRCESPSAYFDPDSRSTACVECTTSNR